MPRKRLYNTACPFTLRLGEENYRFVRGYALDKRTSVARVVDVLLEKMRRGEVNIDEVIAGDAAKTAKRPRERLRLREERSGDE